MMTLSRLDRDFQAQRYDALLRAVLSHHGLNLPSSLRLRLSAHPACAIALSLLRILELSYGPTPLSNQMLAVLLDHQQADGSIDQDPLPTACLGAVLHHLLRDPASPYASPRLVQAHSQAILALASMQACSSYPTLETNLEDPCAPDTSQALLDLPGFAHPDDRTAEEQAATAAFVLLLLARDPHFRQTIRLAELLDWFADHEHLLDPQVQDLWRLVHAELAPPPRTHRIALPLAA